MEYKHKPGHWDDPQNPCAVPADAISDRSAAHPSAHARHEPIPDDPITGLKYGLAFGIAIWAFLLSLGIAVFA